MEEETLTPEEQAFKEMDEAQMKEAQKEDQPEEADNTETPKQEEQKKEEKPAKEEESDEESEEDDEDASDDEDHRQPQVPYKKYKEQRDKAKSLESEIGSLRADIEAIKNSGKTQSQQADEIEKLAEENGVDPTFVKKLSDTILSKAKSPISEEELAEWREQKEQKKQQDMFSDEFEGLIELRPDAKEHRAELKKLAFSTKYAGKNFKPLLEIYVREIEPNTGKKKTMESSSKKSDTTITDFENMSEEEALKLPPEKFLEWTDRKA